MVEQDEQVPPPLTGSGERIQQRDHGSAFARLPEDETHQVSAPGAGPAGGMDDSVSAPMVVGVAGIGVLLTTFLVGHWATLLLGGLLVVVALGMGAARNRGSRVWKGVGTITKHSGGRGL